MSMAGRMSITAPRHDHTIAFAGTDLPGGSSADSAFAELHYGFSRGRTDLQRLAAAVEALIRATPGKLEAAARAGVYGGLTGYLAQADLRAQALRETIAQGRFRLAYQPVVSLSNHSVQHFEALLRPIASPNGPNYTTQEFVAFAEAAGLAEELDLAVLGQALAALRATPGTRVAVNVSGLSIQSRDFQERALALIGATAAAPGAGLLVELTETAEIGDVGTAAATLDRLRAAGVPVCLDDFGAGSAGFRYLRDFRIDYVKIDGAYVRAAAAGGQARSFVASMRDLAHSVGARVIAEMVETEADAATMTELGVEFGQGWLFGRPGPLPSPLPGPRCTAWRRSAGAISPSAARFPRPFPGDRFARTDAARFNRHRTAGMAWRSGGIG